jgi:predicted TIM-barrel fold metal-dependent hydrolase
MEISRRALLMALAASDNKPIDTHIHLFEPARFPYHPAATYQPPAETLAHYAPFAAATLSHSIIVHPEPYQDDHRYLEYCFENEPRKGFFKGTCLFDGLDPQTPARMAALTKKWPNRIVALRVHAIGKEVNKAGAIKDRDLSDPRMAQTWAAATKLGLAIQMHMTPQWAPAVGKLVKQTPGAHVVIDLQPLARRIHGAFGAEKIIWGGLGMNAADHAKQKQAFETIWSYLPEAARQQIRFTNTAKLYHFA